MGHRKYKSLEEVVVSERKEELREAGKLVWKLTGVHAKNAHVGKTCNNSSIKIMVLKDYVRLNKRGI